MDVQHFIAAFDIERFKPPVPSRHVLRGVGSTIVVPQQVDFPLEVKQLCFFVRVFNAVGAVQFQIGMMLHRDARNPKFINDLTSDLFEMTAFESANDVSIAWELLSFPLPGLYEFRLTDVNKPRRILKREYVEVRR